jgi:hypothetical protein
MILIVDRFNPVNEKSTFRVPVKTMFLTSFSRMDLNICHFYTTGRGNNELILTINTRLFPAALSLSN